ncbi:MAG: amino acid ABC transporter permease [Acidimicrobiia bacterium]
MTSARVTDRIVPPEPPPEARQPGAVVWLRRNLFGSLLSTIVTVVLGAVVLLALRGIFGFLFAEERLWEVIPRNATNYAIEGYPRSNIGRIWLSLHIVLFLTGFAMAVWRPTGRTSPVRIAAGLRSAGIVGLIVGLLAPDSFGARFAVGVGGLVLIAASVILVRLARDRALVESVRTLTVVGGGVVFFLAVIWLLPIASSTQIPLTIGAVVGVIGHGLGRVVAPRIPAGTLRAVTTALGLVSLPVIYLHIQRNPVVDWATVTGSWIPWIAGIGVAGVGLIVAVSRADRERGGLINAAVVVSAAALWLMSAPMVARALLIVLAVLTLATPTFASSAVGRRNMILTWLAAALFVSYIFVVGDAGTGLDTRNEYYGGLNLTMMLAVGALLLSFPMGVLLALGRTSTMPIFRLLSTGYIEVVRGVPLITVLFISRFGILNFLPPELEFDPNVLVLGGMTAFSAAYLAENVRGGLQSIPRGQYEAAKALGMTTAQMTMLITLPQALRAVIPAIVGQVIALFKDTSLVAIVGLAEFFRVARDIVPNQPASLGSILENLLFAAAVYWIFTYNFSRASQRLERKLGVGTR